MTEKSLKHLSNHEGLLANINKKMQSFMGEGYPLHTYCHGFESLGKTIVL